MTLTNIDHEKQIYCFKVLYAIVGLIRHMNNPCIGCSEREMQALLAFKQGLVDVDNRLLSWGRQVQTKDCCQWDGVYCSNHTGHVVKLDLGGGQSLQGTISPKLVELQDLEYLNLSLNNFSRNQIPDFIGSLKNLRYLDLSSANFGGEIPYQLENLTHLEYLYLRSDEYFPGWFDDSIYAKNLSWLSNLSCLKHFDLSNTNLTGVVAWLEAVNMLPKLRNLILQGCNLPPPIISSVSVMNSSKSLVRVDLSYNNLNSSIFQWLSSTHTNLVDLDLSANNFNGSSIPDDFGNMSSLAYLDLSWNNFTGVVGWLEAVNMLPKLRNLILQRCNLPPPIISSVSVMNSSISLVRVDLSFNNLNSLIFQRLSGTHTNLVDLDLSANNFNGSSIPDDFGNMSSLAYLNLSDSRLKGGIPNSFAKLCRLRELHLRNNSLSGQLSDIIDILSKCAQSTLEYLDISENHGIMGSVPDLTNFLSLKHLYLGGNKLNGTIPENIGQMSKLETISLMGILWKE